MLCLQHLMPNHWNLRCLGRLSLLKYWNICHSFYIVSFMISMQEEYMITSIIMKVLTGQSHENMSYFSPKSKYWIRNDLCLKKVKPILVTLRSVCIITLIFMTNRHIFLLNFPFRCFFSYFFVILILNKWCFIVKSNVIIFSTTHTNIA